ncbi:MAG TPA: DUF2357 domain-containing protein [Symbiobacteriaceae bacterium]|nr:DUF2357 domain-containing protein [Symbiobacteriaceae bacterium]
MLLLEAGTGLSGALFRVWPDAEPIPSGTMEEARTYRLQLVNALQPTAAHLYVDGERLPRDFAGPDGRTVEWTWSLGFHAGIVELRLELGNGVNHHFTVTTDPDRAKVTREDFMQMVRETVADTLALISLSSFKWQIGRGTGTAVPQIAQLEFLYSRMDELDDVVKQIQSHPVRVLEAHRAELPIHKVRKLLSTDLQRSLASKQVVKSDNPYLPAQLRGFLPLQIRTAVKTAGIDIKEHRAIKSTLRTWGAFLSRAADLLELGNLSFEDDVEWRGVRATWVRRCRGMAHRLYGLLNLPLFQEVADVPTPVSSTPIFRRNPTYSRFLSLHRDFRMGIAPLPGDFLNIPLARTYALYELWVFLRMVRAASLINPNLDPAPLLKTITQGQMTPVLDPAPVPIADGVRMFFQREYREFWLESDGVGTYTRRMRPDICLESRRHGRLALLVVDAKYRIGHQLNDAISSVHIYRDSLIEGASGQRVTQGAFLVTPHAPNACHADWTVRPMPDRLFSEAFQDEFGVGAATLKPGMSVEQVASLLMKWLGRLTHAQP